MAIACNVNINIKQYIGLHISSICSNSFHKNKTNHCAHFISHILGFRFGYTCRHQTKKGIKSNAANIRVQEVFKRCSKVGTWTNKPANLKFCLAFVTKSTNVNLKQKE